jgi:hypothetical protein
MPRETDLTYSGMNGEGLVHVRGNKVVKPRPHARKLRPGSNTGLPLKALDGIDICPSFVRRQVSPDSKSPLAHKSFDIQKTII